MPQDLLQQALADLRQLYLPLVSGGVQDANQAWRITEGLLTPVIARQETQAQTSPPQPSMTNSAVNQTTGRKSATAVQPRLRFLEARQ